MFGGARALSHGKRFEGKVILLNLCDKCFSVDMESLFSYAMLIMLALN